MESTFSLLGKPQNFDEKVKLDEDTPSLFIFIFYITVYNICYISFEVIYYFEGHDYCFGMFKYDLNIACMLKFCLLLCFDMLEYDYGMKNVSIKCCYCML
jgi:hypothetical protein